MKKNQKGFGPVEGLLIFLIIAILGGVSYYVWHSQKNTSNSYNNASAALSSTVSPKSTKKTTTQPANSQNYVTIKEWSVKLPLSSGLAGTTYKISSSGGVQSADITVPNSQCTPMATIYRGSANDTDPTTQGFDGGGTSFQANNDKQLGGYYYSFRTGNGSTCFSGEQIGSNPAVGVQTETVYSQLKTAFDNISSTSN